MKVRLGDIRNAKPCSSGWARFLESLKNTDDMDQIVKIEDIVNTNDEDDAAWVTSCLVSREIQIHMAVNLIRLNIYRMTAAFELEKEEEKKLLTLFPPIIDHANNPKDERLFFKVTEIYNELRNEDEDEKNLSAVCLEFLVTIIDVLRRITDRTSYSILEEAVDEIPYTCMKHQQKFDWVDLYTVLALFEYDTGSDRKHTNTYADERNN